MDWVDMLLYMWFIECLQTLLQFKHVGFDAYTAKYMHTMTQPFMTFKILFKGLSKFHIFLMGNSPAQMLTNIIIEAPAMDCDEHVHCEETLQLKDQSRISR